MKIVIDLRIFSTKAGGIGRYNQKFLEELVKIDHKNKYILLFKEDPNIKLPDNFSIQICDCAWYSFKEQFVVPYMLYQINPDLVYFPHFNVPILYSGKFVVTIHDLIMTKFPSKRSTTHSKFFFKVKYWFYNQVIRHAVFNAEKIIAVSKFTADDIKKYFNLGEEEAKKIQVVYEGVIEPKPSQSQNLYLPENYFLYVGNAYPHKNLEFLMATFGDFIKKYPDYHLVLVGEKNYFYKRLEKENITKNIIFTGHLSDNKLAGYYKNALAYIFPSLYEGFGLPPLEAMTYAVPVLSSNESCLPEILEDSVLYFNPKDKNDLLAKMEDIIKQPELRDKLIKSGQEQIKKYSWEKMARNIWEIFENLV
ncbi:glycosyltransferase family 1 protein [Candidatus Parcubacteria bacterium]|nr:MAG: glycosyltransferase family 1 protein [Candidatus Parcubacteria bacterium]